MGAMPSLLEVSSAMQKNYKHLSLEERITIEHGLKQGFSFKRIARSIGRSTTTITREILKNSCAKQSGAFGSPFNDCENRFNCTLKLLCDKQDCRRKKCAGCKLCASQCPFYSKQSCPLLKEVPYTCNGCKQKHKCTLEKFVYSAKKADSIYRDNLAASRNGINMSVQELARIDAIVSPLVKQGQSPYVIWENHKDELMLDSKTIYKYIKLGLFSASPLDLQRMVKMRPRKRKKSIKIEPACRVGRTYRDYLSFVKENPDTPIVQMDTLIGKRGGAEPVLLTLHFVQAELMLAFLRKDNTAKSAYDVFEHLFSLLGAKTFKRLFSVILTDNGSEFSHPSALEFDSGGHRRTRMFYCDPNSSWQKGALETNHSLLRLVIPKGTSLSPYQQRDFDLLLSHVNSYPRKKLNGKTPIAMFSYIYEEPWILDKLHQKLIEPDSVVLNLSLLKR